jgi:GT2 family glycosyltransferase
MADLSIIIVSYKGWNRLTRCLESLASFTHIIPEVIIVDNRSDDETIFKIEEKFSKLRFVHNPVNGGFAHGCNLGAANAKGEFLLFLNPDTIVTESAIEKLLNYAGQNPAITILSCRQINEDGKESIACGSFPQTGNLTGFQRAISRIIKSGMFTANTFSEADMITPDWISGSLMMVRKESFLKIHGFDEDFWMYHEDVDLCKRVRDAGGEVAVFRDITIVHNHGGSSRINLKTTSLTKTEVLISRHIYISKHKTGPEGAMIQIFLIFNNLISSGLMALSGILLFFIPKVFVRAWIFLRLISYYAGSLFRLSWISPRSVNFPYKPAKDKDL